MRKQAALNTLQAPPLPPGAQGLNAGEERRFIELMNKENLTAAEKDTFRKLRAKRNKVEERPDKVLYNGKEYIFFGVSKDGLDIYSGPNGFRLLRTLPDGVLIHEPVGIKTTRAGILTTQETRQDDYKTSDELKNEAETQAKKDDKTDEEKWDKVKSFISEDYKKQKLSPEQRRQFEEYRAEYKAIPARAHLLNRSRWLKNGGALFRGGCRLAGRVMSARR